MSDEIRTEMIQLLPRLRSFARGLTGAVDQADDLVQQTVEKGLRNLGSYTPGTRLDSWLFRIMRNSWIDTIRARRQTQPLDEGEGLSLVAEDGRTTTEARLYLLDVQREMNALPEEQRTVLMLVCVEGMRYREVAEALEIPEGTVMSRLGRARAALAAALKLTPKAARSKGFGR